MNRDEIRAALTNSPRPMKTYSFLAGTLAGALLMCGVVAVSTHSSSSSSSGSAPELDNSSGLILPRGELIGTAGVTRLYMSVDVYSQSICYITERDDGAGSISCVPAPRLESGNATYR